MSGRPDAFWLCHECGAQMRPIRRDGNPHCASCDGEFLEILDTDVNPDPFHELPPPPPVRPGSSPPGPARTSSPPESPGAGAQGGFMQSLLSGLFGAAANPEHPGGQATTTTGGGGAGRTFTFNIGGGTGSVMFGSYNGGQPGGGEDGGLENFFPGFGPPPSLARRPQGQRLDGQPLGPNDAMGPEDLIRALFSIIAEDGHAPPFAGPRGRANLGDYVMTDQGFDQILEQLMQAAGPQGPIPASDVVIEGLPRFTFSEETLEKSPFKDCPVCKDDFAVGDEVMRIPCQHVFHPDCLQPWLKVNGSCPVCRFSLVPEDGNGPAQAAPTTPQTPAAAGAPSAVTNILQRLWGQSGTTSPTSPTSNTTLPQDAPTAPQNTHSEPHDTHSPSAPSNSQDPPEPSLSSAIPDDYRQRHRQREQRQHEDEPIHDDLD